MTTTLYQASKLVAAVAPLVDDALVVEPHAGLRMPPRTTAAQRLWPMA